MRSLTAILLVLFVGCDWYESPTPIPDDFSPHTGRPVSYGFVSFDPVPTGRAAFAKDTTIVFTTLEQWNQFWVDHDMGDAQFPPPDFTNRQVIAVSYGKQNAGCHSMHELIEYIRISEYSLKVLVRPEPLSSCQAVVYPQQFVSIDTYPGHRIIFEFLESG